MDQQGRRRDAEGWISTGEAARRAGMSDWWIREQIACARLPARIYRTGRRTTVRIRASDLEVFLARWSSPGE